MQGVLGYVILRPLMTAVGFVASLIGVYGDGELRFDRVYLYTTIVSNISQVGLCIKLHQLVDPVAASGHHGGDLQSFHLPLALLWRVGISDCHEA